VTPSFAALGVPEQLCATLTRRGIDEPFPIQAATLPDALGGRDIAGRAPTGSGKTLAFGLTVAAQALAASKPQSRRPRALVLVPTRELAAQVQRELQALIPKSAGPVVSVYGGVGYGPQRKALAIGASAVVACPGRLEDLVSTNDVFLDAAELVVLDEADRMADMGFMPAVKRLLDQTPSSRQTLLFSATLDGDVDALVQRYQRDPARHAVAGSEADAGDVTHLLWRMPRAERIDVTRDVVVACGPTIVFCRTCHGADRVAKQLERAGVAAVAIHGRRTQGQRDKALAAFTAGRAPALVATDVAARGIHVDGVGAVVHYDLPEDPKDYVHRSGRTGRAGATGIVVGLVAKEDGDRDKKVRLLQRSIDDVGQVGPVDLDALEAIVAASPVAVLAEQRVPVGAGVGGTGATASSAGSLTIARPADGSALDDVPGERRHDERGTGGGRGNGAGRSGRGGERRRGEHGERGERGGRGRRGAESRSYEQRGDRSERNDRPASTGRGERPGGSTQGTVTVWHADKGYGFIARPGKGDVFVHTSNVGGERPLAAGTKVSFEVAPGRRGAQAVNVRLA
jgi:superfamily II DNA/RNA helicase